MALFIIFVPRMFADDAKALTQNKPRFLNEVATKNGTKFTDKGALTENSAYNVLIHI